MGMKRIITSTVLAIILFTFLSCERVMILDANEKPVVVVDCMISNEPVQILKLSFSKGASKDTYEKVKDAERIKAKNTFFEKKPTEFGYWTMPLKRDKHIGWKSMSRAMSKSLPNLRRLYR